MSKDQITTPDQSEENTTTTEEIGGPTGPEPTRYGDWEKNGRVSDFQLMPWPLC